MQVNDIKKPIVIADISLKDACWIVLSRLQQIHEIKILAIDKYVGTVERVVRIFSRIGLIDDEAVERTRVDAINEKTGDTIKANQITIRKISAARLW